MDRALEPRWRSRADPCTSRCPARCWRSRSASSRSRRRRAGRSRAAGSRSGPDRGGGGTARPRAQPLIVTAELGRSSERRWTAWSRSPSAGAFPVLESSPIYVNFPRGALVPRRLGLREPGLPGRRRGRRRAGRRLRRAVVPGLLAAGRRRHRDPARRGSVLLAVPGCGRIPATSRWPPIRRWPCRCSRPRSVAASTRRRSGARGLRLAAAHRMASGDARAAAARGRAGRPSASSGPRGASARCSTVTTIVVNEYPLDLRTRRAGRARDLLRVAALGRARVGPRRGARREARGAGDDRHRDGRRRSVHLRRTDGRPPRGAGPQAPVPDRDLQQRRLGRPSERATRSVHPDGWARDDRDVPADRALVRRPLRGRSSGASAVTASESRTRRSCRARAAPGAPRRPRGRPTGGAGT